MEGLCKIVGRIGIYLSAIVIDLAVSRKIVFCVGGAFTQPKSTRKILSLFFTFYI